MIILAYFPYPTAFINGVYSQSNVLYSDDHGRTWNPGGSLPYREHGRPIFTGESIVSQNVSLYILIMFLKY